ncbi:MAG: hypothetical protein HY553_07130 [Elusimicrobia bacterium]|nr:hypothetical protein [Elusimicrobiota bacterium]
MGAMEMPVMIVLQLGLFLVLVPVVVIAARKAAAKRRAYLDRMAAELGGRVVPHGGLLFERCHLAFDMADAAPAVIEFYSTGGKHPTLYTDFKAPVPAQRPWRLTVRPQHALDAVGAFLGLQDIRLGAPAVDDAFVIKSDNELLAMTYLCQPEVQHALMELRALVGNDAIELRVDHGSFLARKLTHLEDEAALRRFFAGATLLYRRLPAGQRFELMTRASK